MAEHRRGVPCPEFRPHDAGIRTEQLFHEHTHRIGGQRHIVVEETEKAVIAFHQTQRLIGRSSETRISRYRAHQRTGHAGSHLLGYIARFTGDQHQDT